MSKHSHNDDDSNNQDPLLLPHEIDGIRELDNKLPRWWVWLFYMSIFFGIGYMVHYHVLRAGPLMEAEYQLEMKKGDELKAVATEAFEKKLDTVQPSTDSAILTKGSQVFRKMCAPCHREDAGGLVGPNLCDDYWIHGPLFKDNLRIILDGVPAKGMITWKGVLNPNEILAVASYIYSKRGSNPPNPKPPENLAPANTGPSVYE